MNWISDFVAGIFKPAADLVDEIHVSSEEKGKIKIELLKVEQAMQDKLLEFHAQVLAHEVKLKEFENARAIAEVASESWFVRHYRPAIIVGMFLLISAKMFGFVHADIPEMFVNIFGAAFGISLGAPQVLGAIAKRGKE